MYLDNLNIMFQTFQIYDLLNFVSRENVLNQLEFLIGNLEYFNRSNAWLKIRLVAFGMNDL